MKLSFIFLIFFALPTWAFDHEHALLGEVLSKHLVRNGAQTLVDYEKLKAAPTQLEQYIKSLAEVSASEYGSWSDDQKLATLINGYNAWTLQLIVKHHPVTSIRKIGPFYSNPWKQEFITWLGKKVNLDKIENGVIRKDFKEPRIHFALVCASIGCPSLQEKPFVAKTLEAQLEKAEEEFLTDKNKNDYELAKDSVELKVSSIFKWYKEDFGLERELKDYLVRGMKIQDVARGKTIELSYKDYDWGLNEVK